MDIYVCQHDRKRGQYHRHRGPHLSEYYSFKEVMLNLLAFIENMSPQAKIISKPENNNIGTTPVL